MFTPEALSGPMFALVVFGIPIAAYCQLSVMIEHMAMERRCGDCSVCKAKKVEEARIRAENGARRRGACVRGHGVLNKERVCNTCGWS